MQSKKESWKFFNVLSKKYDFLNHILSLGLHLSWKSRLVEVLPTNKTSVVLDLATGTCDILRLVSLKKKSFLKLIGLDMAQEMLNVGQNKLNQSDIDATLICGDAHQMPFDDQEIDVITMSFGIRNCHSIDIVFKEMFRVLKPGASVFILEFSKPKNIILKALHLIYLRTVVPVLGGLLTGQWKSYVYLDKTIESFLYGEAFCKQMKQAGFNDVYYKPLSGGIVGLYQAVKPG